MNRQNDRGDSPVSGFSLNEEENCKITADSFDGSATA